MQKLLISLLIIFFGLIIGYIIQRLILLGKIKTKYTLEKQRKFLQIVALLILNPIASVGAIWDINLNSINIILLPVIGSIAILIGGFSSLVLIKILKLERKQAGAFFSCGAMTNIGSIGALIVFIFLGEHAFAFVPMYKLFEPVIYYSLWFPIAKSYSLDNSKNSKENIFKLLKDPFILITLFSITLGFILNATNLERPSFYADLNSIIIPFASLLLLASIGMAMKFSKIKKYLKPSLQISFLKFLLVPFFTTTIAYFLNLGSFDNGLILKVIIILSSMPVGFTALVPPSIYNLDLDLANALWMVTTALLAVVIPLQMIVISFL